MKIIHTNNGLAACYTGPNNEKWIEINRLLKQDLYLYNEILNHEKQHFRSNSLTDIRIELNDAFNFKKQLHLTKFLFRHPSLLFSNILPFEFHKKGIMPNYFVILNCVCLLALGIIGGLLLL